MPYETPLPAQLIMLHGPQPNLVLQLTRPSSLIGRHASCDIVVDDPGVSRHHARITRQGEQWIVEDLGSSNGTFVNGQRITGPVALSPGCQLGLGPGVLAGFQIIAPVAVSPPQVRGDRLPAGGYAIPAAAAPASTSALTWGLIGAVAVLVALAIGGGAVAYLLWLRPATTEAPAALAALTQPAAGPQVTIQEPAAGRRVDAGRSLLVFATARDPQQVTRIDLWIDDVLVAQMASPAPEGVTPLNLVHRWSPSGPGPHNLLVRAYNAAGTPGDSPLVSVIVSGEAAPPTEAQYVVQPGDTIESLAERSGTSPQAIRDANPGRADDLAPGQVIVIPVPSGGPQPAPAGSGAAPTATHPGYGPSPAPPSAAPTATRPGDQPTPAGPSGAPTATRPGDRPTPGGAAPAPTAGQPAAPTAAGQPPPSEAGQPPQPPPPAPGQPPQPPPPPPPAPNAVLKPPTLLGADVGDCRVTLTWQDNADNEDGFAIMRAPAGQPAFQALQPLVNKVAGTGQTQQFVDRVPGPNSYVYYVIAGTLTGGRAPGNPRTVLVPATAGCPEPPGYRQVIFQPATVRCAGCDSLALFFDVGNRIFRRVPLDSRLAPGDWSALRQVAVAPTYLKPGDPLVLSVAGEGRAGAQSRALGSVAQSHALQDLQPDKLWRGQASAGGLDITYRLWVENATWGQSTNSQLTPPGKPRLAADARELDILRGCVPGKCDPKAARSLVWDWSGDARTIEGYLLLRRYACAGQESHLTDVIVGADQKGKIIAPALEPAGCVARYQASAFGPAGVSPPGEVLELQPQAAPVAKVAVVFDRFEVKRPLAAMEVAEVAFQANDQSVASQAVILPSVGIAPGSQVVDVARQFLDGLQPNNRLPLSLGAGEGLQIGFNARIGNDVCTAQQILAPGPGETWAKFIGQSITLASVDGQCEAQAHLDGAGISFDDKPEPRPKAHVTVKDPFYVGRNAFVPLRNDGPDVLVDRHIHVSVEWVLLDADSKIKDRLLVMNEDLPWPSGATEFVFKAASRDKVDVLWGSAARLQLSFEILALDFDLTATASALRDIVTSPLGYMCRRNEDCASGYCAGGGKCAPRDGTGQAGEYCHHDNQCQTGLCVCPNGWEGNGGFCEGWQAFSPYGAGGHCSAPAKNGEVCDRNGECVSGYCADGRLCAPKDGTGTAGDYCHHDNHCQSGLCLCPDGWEGGQGFCKGWRDFTATTHGTCIAPMPNGYDCERNAECTSGYCADGKKCAPKDGTGQGGDYCHHDNQCATRSCDCPGEDYRVMGGPSFCGNWEDFTPILHGVCRAPGENGQACLRNEQCTSGYCADGRFCAPRDGTGQAGDYCHHDNHCLSHSCDCPGDDYRIQGALSFCPDWREFDADTHGVCRAQGELGAPCLRNEHCVSGYCANSRFCAPHDGTGAAGDYCHHNNHCSSGKCDCPLGTDWLGFCHGWENFTATTHGTCKP